MYWLSSFALAIFYPLGSGYAEVVTTVESDFSVPIDRVVSVVEAVQFATERDNSFQPFSKLLGFIIGNRAA